MSVHHIYPKRHWKRLSEILAEVPFKSAVMWLCRTCHNLIEVLIPYDLVEDVEFYPRIVQVFLEDTTIVERYRENPKRFVQRVRAKGYEAAA